MIGALDSGEQGTRRAVAPSGKKECPAEGEELNPCSEVQRSSRLRDVYFGNASFLLARWQLSGRLGELDVLGMNIFIYRWGRM
jgi:hypothetical protein